MKRSLDIFVKGYDIFKTPVQIFERQCEIKENNDSDSDDKISLDNFPLGTDQSTSANEIEVDENNPAEDRSIQRAHSEDKDLEEQDEQPQIESRKKPAGEKIISSPQNTDAVYTRKRNQKAVGHKTFVTETCDSDNPFQVITDVNLERATHADAKETERIERRLDQNGMKPESLYRDAGFVNGKTILASECLKRLSDTSGRGSIHPNIVFECCQIEYIFSCFTEFAPLII